MSRAFCLLALMAPLTASAQDNRFFDAHRIQIAAYDGDLRDPLLLQRPGRFRQWDWFAGGVFEYANAALVRYEEVAGRDPVRTNIVDHIVALNINGGVAFHERFRLDVAVPVFFTSWDGGNSRSRGAAFGDLRLSAMVAIIRPDEEEQGFGLGVVGQLDLPTGAQKQFLGLRTVGGGGQLAASYAYNGFTATGTAGVHFYPKLDDLDNLVGADVLNFGIGVGYLVHETTGIHLETQISPALVKNREALTGSPVELVASVRHRRPNGLNLVFGGAAGLTRGAGAARFRLFAGLGYGLIAEPPPKDRDLDGILDVDDACPEDPETFNDYNDADGCPDQLANVDLLVVYDGKPIAGAEMEVTYGEEDKLERMKSRETPRRKEDLKPGLMVDAKATSGACLAGDAGTTLEEGDNELTIQLRPARGGKVIYELVDPDGKPVQGAVATWRTDAEGCADPEGYNLGPDGQFEHPIGAGEHTVFIDAPGYRIYRETAAIQPGDVYVIRTEMKPTKVQIDKKQIKILEKVYFETAKADIKPQSFDLLDEVADTILANEIGRVRVEGHTDSRGSDSYNLDLSQRRADSVRAYLTAKGVPANQLIAVGYGETQPIASNNSESGRAQNRRVVFTLIDQDSQVIEVKDDEGGE